MGISVATPEFPSRDHWGWDFDARPEAEVTDITHVLEALTVTESPLAGVADIRTAAGEEAERLET